MGVFVGTVEAGEATADKATDFLHEIPSLIRRNVFTVEVNHVVLSIQLSKGDLRLRIHLGDVLVCQLRRPHARSG